MNEMVIRRLRMAARVLLIPLLLLSSVSTVRAQSTIEQLRVLWRAGNYVTAFARLSEYRREPYGKTFEVYYMAATSLCRIPSEQDRGVIYLNWILDNYNLDSGARRTVEEERLLCRDVGRNQPVLISFNTTAVTAGVSGSTKVFYFVDQENALRSVPVNVVEEIPLEVFQQRLFPPSERNAAIENVATLSGSNTVAAASTNFVLASRAGHSREDLRRMGGGLDGVFEFYVEEFGMRPPEHLISVYLVSSFEDVQALSRSLHGIEVAPQSLGYSYRDDMSMIGYVPTTAFGTLSHELLHLMIRNNFGDVPPWLDEGLAALYEVSEMTDQGLKGRPNWRGRVLSELQSSAPSVEELVTMNWVAFSGEEEFSATRQAANHATARYFLLYLQERGLLTQVYTAFQSRDIGTDSAQLLASVLGTDLQAADVDYRGWLVKTL